MQKKFIVNLKATFVFLAVVSLSCNTSPDSQKEDGTSPLYIEHDQSEGLISIFRKGDEKPVLVQHAREGVRPYIHPIIAPDGRGELTEYSPAHHKHQTGLYWGLKKVNGRDYFMNWKEDYWQRISAEVLASSGNKVSWQTQYYLLDENGSHVLRETQTWSFVEREGRFLLDLEWAAEAEVDVTMEKFYVGGLFLRMPWREGIRGAVVNASGQANGEAEGQRSIWADVGIQVDGRNDLAHIAMLDHPDNRGFPNAWRVDNELGVGPSRQILGDWSIPRGDTEVIRYRLIAYTGNLEPDVLQSAWKEFVCE